MFLPKAQDKKPLVAALVCALLSVVMLRTNMLSLFFLSPLGFVSSFGASFMWLAFIVASVFNGIFSLGVRIFYGAGMAGIGMDILSFVMFSLAFTWILCGNSGSVKLRTSYRVIIAAVAVSLCFMLVIVTSFGGSFADIIKTQSEAVSAIIIASAGADAVRRSALESAISPDVVYEIIKTLALRGGAVVSCVFMFIFNRQAGKTATIIFRRQKLQNELPFFHVHSNFIWALSISLAAILLSSLLNIGALEILAWNVLVICAILFFGQGFGIALFNFQKRAMSPGFRLFICVLVFLAVITPVVNVVLLGLLLLLGIAENWLPLRAPKNDGSASTPES